MANLTRLFNSVNGLFIPGGGTDLFKGEKEIQASNNTAGTQGPHELTDFAKAGIFLVKLAKEANDAGDYFPVWGTCLGFELLMLEAAGGDTSILSLVNSTNNSLDLKFLKVDR